MRIGEYVIGRRSRGWLVAVTNFYAIYRDKIDIEFVELKDDVSPILCSQCNKLKTANDRPWYYLDGRLAKHKKCPGCGKTRFEHKESGWRTWHLKKCPKCKGNPRCGVSRMRSDARKFSVGSRRPRIGPCRRPFKCIKCKKWRRK
jgi:uncharacterized Zn-finger protein